MTDHVQDTLSQALGTAYRIERELGAGGMATVYLAHDLKHDRQVAIKVLKPELGAVLGAERFLSEIKVTANLQHPNLLPLFDSGNASGLLYYVMPYLEGETLRALLQREPQLPVHEVIRLVTLMAGALDFAHTRGVVHRDLKPDNILLQAGQPVIADFGIALAVAQAGGERVTQTGLSLGTPHYMSPEQAAGERAIDARSDQYALGALAYEMLMGEPPHTGATAQVIIARLMSEAPRSIRTARPAVSASVDAAVQRALSKSPADRFATCGDFARALAADTMTAASTAVASPPSSFGLIAFGVIATALTVLGTVVWLTVRNQRPTVVANADLIAVMPLGATSDSALVRLGQDLAVTLSANLDGVGALRSIDAATLLMRARKLPSPIPNADAQQLAKALGARSVMTGTLVHEGDRVRATVVLRAVGSDSTLARATALAAPHDVAALTDSLSWGLLRGVWRQGVAPSPVLAGLTTASFDALRSFLDGERAFQRLDTKAALVDYRRAFDADSNFAQAYLRYDYVNGWLLADPDPVVTKRLLALKNRLPERERLWVETRERQLPVPERVATWKALSARYPDYPPFLMAAADPIVHYGPIHGIAISDATPMLLRLDQLVPEHGDTKLHLAAVLSNSETLSEAADAASAAGTSMSSAPAKFMALSGELLRVRATGGPMPPPERAMSLARAWATEGEGNPVVQMVSGFLGLWNAQIPYQLEMVGRVRSAGIFSGDLERSTGFGESSLRAARGDWVGALEAARRTEQSGLAFTYKLTAARIAGVGAWLQAIDPRVADSVVRQARAMPADGATALDRAEVRWVDGIIGVVLGDEARVRTVIRELTADTTRVSQHTARTVSAMWLNTKNPDAAADSLRAVTDDVMHNGGYVLAAESLARLLIAQKLRKRGDAATVERYLMWPDALVNTPSTLGAMMVAGSITEFERGSAFDALGNREAAIKHYRRFVDNYDQPPPAHRARVEEAKQRLAVLEKSDAAKPKSVPK